jgi:hypothetical protein
MTMRKLILIMTLAALAGASGCTATGGWGVSGVEAPIASPAHLQGTLKDEKALNTLWRGFDALLAGVDALIVTGAIKPGSERAATVKAGITTLQTALNAATEAQRARSAARYDAALDRAGAAFLQLQRLLAKGE